MHTLKQLGLLTKRVMVQNLTNADTLITVVAMPVFMLLFFVYVLGGNIVTTGGASAGAYLRYALPGFLLLTMAMGAAYTAVRINHDRTSGYLARLHSLPIPRWVILGAHVLASLLFMVLAEVAVFAVGLAIGYRTDASGASLAAFGGLSLLFGLAITLVAIPFSLKATNDAAASGFSYVLLMLLFVSSALMPTAGMAKAVRAFATHQPMTPIVNVARGLLDRSATIAAADEWQALLWLAAGIIGFGWLAYAVYARLFLNK